MTGDEIKSLLELEAAVHNSIRTLAEELLASRKRIEELDEAWHVLDELVDIQNGPPLIKYTDDWNKVMQWAFKLLEKPDPEDDPALDAAGKETK